MAWRAFLSLSERSLLRPLLDWCADGIPPLGPAAVVISDAIVAEEVGENEPGMGGTLADAAVGDYVVAFLEALLSFVDCAQRAGFLEASIQVRGACPGHTASSLDVPSTQRPLLGIVRHMRALARVFLRRANVDQWLAGVGVLAHFPEESADLLVVASGSLVVGGRQLRHIGGKWTMLLLPLY